VAERNWRRSAVPDEALQGTLDDVSRVVGGVVIAAVVLKKDGVVPVSDDCRHIIFVGHWLALNTVKNDL
jgi:hypothetical protein